MIRRVADKVLSSATLMTWSSLVIRMGGLALLLPLVLTRLDTREVLVWQMLSTIAMLVNWTDFGFSPTFSRLIAFTRGGGSVGDLYTSLPRSRRRPNEAVLNGKLDMAEVIVTQRAIYRYLVTVAMMVAAVLGTSFLWRPMDALPHPDRGWFALACTGMAAALTLLNGSNVSILTGFNRIAQVRKVEAAIGTMQLATTAMATLAGGDLAVIVACYSFWSLPMFISNLRNVAQLHTPDTTAKSFDPVVFAAVWPAAWRSGIGILMSTGLIQGSGLVYAQFASAGNAAAYLLGLRIFTAISQISQAPFYSRLPAMATLRSRRDYDAVTLLARRGMALAHWTFVSGALVAMVAMPIGLRIIQSSVHWPPYLICASIALAFFVERYVGMHMQLYSLTNHIVWHIVNGATGLLMIAMFFVLRPFADVAAMPLAMLVAYLFIGSRYASKRALNSLGKPRWPFERATTLGPGLALAAGLVVGACL